MKISFDLGNIGAMSARDVNLLHSITICFVVLIIATFIVYDVIPFVLKFAQYDLQAIANSYSEIGGSFP